MEYEKTVPLVPPIGRYRIIRELGRGTMGVVYEAFDPVLERAVALKTVRLEPGPQENREFKERFQREAKSAGKLNHPNIVTIHDAGEENGIAYIAMEFLEGRTLRNIIDGGTRPSLEQAADFIIQVAEGLDYAHRFGIIHRDIKPDNIIISGYGRAKITDFGIAQLPLGNLTQTGAIMGTPKYMSPEQIRGERLDGRSDIFSLGVILYEMLAGQPPFTGDSLTSTMYKILQEQPVDPLAGHCSEGMRHILARSLAKDKDRRYAKASEMAVDLRRHLEITPDPALMAATFRGDGPSAARPPTANTRAIAPRESQPAAQEASPSFSRRNKLVLSGAVAVLAIAAIGLGIRGMSSSPAGVTPAATANPATAVASPPARSVAPVVASTPPTTNPPATRTEPPASTASGAEPPQNKASAGEPAPKSTASKTASSKKVAAKPAPETKSATASEPPPKKSFWQRQVDCIKRGICDKPTTPEGPAYTP